MSNESISVSSPEEAMVYCVTVYNEVNEYVEAISEFIANTKEMEALGKNMNATKDIIRSLEEEAKTIQDILKGTFSEMNSYLRKLSDMQNEHLLAEM